jgi:hypothetical protein
MKIKIDRQARRHLKETGGLVTLEARARTGCMVTRQVEARAGKPDHPGDYAQLDVDGITVFLRGMLEHTDGTVRPAEGAIPRSVRIGTRDGQLTVDAG